MAKIIGLLLVLFLIGAGGYSIVNPEKVQCLLGQEDKCDCGDKAASDEIATASSDETSGDAGFEDPLVSDFEFPPLADMLRERVLGFPNAPIKIAEHSSLTCSHCGTFHRDTFTQLKDNYIATGKAYLVYSDFPLNGPALYASMVSRCIPEEGFFDFVQMLFERQDDWAYKTSYLDFLKEEGAKAGLPEDKFSECIQNDELRQGILSRIGQTQERFEVNSTPSFVLNDQDIIAGAVTYDSFSAALDKLLSDGEGSGTSAPSAPTRPSAPAAPVLQELPPLDLPEVTPLPPELQLD